MKGGAVGLRMAAAEVIERLKIMDGDDIAMDEDILNKLERMLKARKHGGKDIVKHKSSVLYINEMLGNAIDKLEDASDEDIKQNMGALIQLGTLINEWEHYVDSGG